LAHIYDFFCIVYLLSDKNNLHDKCGIDADYRGEERYSKRSLACANSEEEKQINDAIKEITPQFSIQS